MQRRCSQNIQSREAEDGSLIRRVAEGDDIAFEILYQRYSPRLHAYLQAQLGQPELAEELCHDVLLVVWHKAARFRRASRLSAWVLSIAQRMAREASMHKRRQTPPLTPSPEVIPEVLDPALHLEYQERQNLIASSLASLPPVLCQTLRLHYDHDYTYRQIADEMGCAKDTVKQRLQQGRRHLAAHMRRRVSGDNVA